jgi:hypothetical protein
VRSFELSSDATLRDSSQERDGTLESTQGDVSLEQGPVTSAAHLVLACNREVRVKASFAESRHRADQRVMAFRGIESPAREDRQGAPARPRPVRLAALEELGLDTHGGDLDPSRKRTVEHALDLVQEAPGDDDREGRMAPFLALVWAVILERTMKGQAVRDTREQVREEDDLRRVRTRMGVNVIPPTPAPHVREPTSGHGERPEA